MSIQTHALLAVALACFSFGLGIGRCTGHQQGIDAVKAGAEQIKRRVTIECNPPARCCVISGAETGESFWTYCPDGGE
jgi:hypothetical protein